MKVDSSDLLSLALRRPEDLPGWPLSAWSALVQQARRAGLLARLAEILERHGLNDRLCAAPRAHLLSAQRLAQAQHEDVRREVEEIRGALAPLGVPVVLLKGAAYVLAGMPAASGRIFSDIDILVPEKRLAEVEAALMGRGWATTHPDLYDQRYYRQWMHELPPLRHIRRQTVLDVHHALLPRTARLKPLSSKLFAAARSLEDDHVLHVLAPVDVVLHSMTHLFHNEEFSHGLRDLSDLDLLLREFGERLGFWRELVERAQDLDLGRPLYYGLRCTQQILDTPVPAKVMATIQQFAPSEVLARFMDQLWSQAMLAHAPTRMSRATALFLLYVRAHWLRMPPLLLLRHLAVKAVRWRKRKVFA